MSGLPVRDGIFRTRWGKHVRNRLRSVSAVFCFKNRSATGPAKRTASENVSVRYRGFSTVSKDCIGASCRRGPTRALRDLFVTGAPEAVRRLSSRSGSPAGNTVDSQQSERYESAPWCRSGRCGAPATETENTKRSGSAWPPSTGYSCTNRLQPRISLPEMRPWMRNEPSS